MENTYTYTARSVENPKQVVTLTLQDHHMSVGLGAPLEQIETVLQQADAGEETAGEAAQGAQDKLWLRPLAISLLERGVGPFRVADVNAAAEEDWLRVNAWYRAGGLALAPVTLVDSAHTVAREVQDSLEEMQLAGRQGKGGQTEFYVTDRTRFEEIGTRFLGQPISSVQQVDLG